MTPAFRDEMAYQIVVGTSDNDTAQGSDAADHFFGRDGNDVFSGAGGDDILQGDAGMISLLAARVGQGRRRYGR